MAENLRFPIVFDLEKGVEAAIKDWDGKYADKLEKAIQKRALNVKLKFDTKAFDNLDDVKRRLSELKITPLTPENKTAIRDLVRELKELARIMEKIQKFKGIELPELQMAKAAKLRKDVEQANEKMRLSQERIRQSNERLILSQQRAAQQADRTSKAYGTQSGYLERLIKKMAIYASFRQVGNFLTSVREVTAQFELQRVSLGAILQDANKGEQIFSQIKQFALKSPISILDLTKYTKQLAAYKIGYDELFDTTKRLADISVGLGVDFQRLTLLYGQVRATGYLRASEVRQATEAGIPLVEELAAKLTKANGELVTAADVMDMISKRAISFDMVKDVFTDMTSAGGAFYQMQEKQGNTLYGLWAKLGDAASVMYEQIGNTGIVNEGMKEAIQMLTELMRNWKAVGLTAATSILPVVAAMAAWKMATKALSKSVATATSERIAAEAKLATAMKGTDVAAQNAARSSLAKAKADEAAAIAAQKNATAQSKLKTGFVSLGKTIASGLGIGIAVMLVTELIYKFYEALTNFRKLKRELGTIYTETATLQDQSVRNFEFLADKAVNAATGSKAQTDALQELNRTYRDILPQETLTIENLAKMKGNYDALTQSIREYIAEQQRQKAESAIMEYYGTKIRDNQNEVRERLYRQGLTSTEVGRFFVELERIAPESGKKVSDKFHDAMLKAGIQDEKRIAEIWNKAFAIKRSDSFTFKEGYLAISGLSNAYAAQADELRGMNEQYRESIGNLGKFSDMQKRVSDAVANATYKTTGGKQVDRDKQGDLLDAMKLNLWVKQTALEIQNNEDIKKAFAYMGEGIKSEWFSIINVLNSNDLGKVSQINFDAIIASVDSLIARLGNKNPEILAILNTFRNYLVAQKKEYENMVPSDLVVNRWRSAWRTIASEVGISRQYMNRFLMQSGDDFEAYRKKIKEELTATINNLRVLQEAIAKTGVGKKLIPGMWKPGTDQFKNNVEYYKAQEAEKKAEALKKLLDELDKIELETGKKKKGSKGSKSDTRLQVLQEVAQTLATINKEYDDLAKNEGASKALADIKEQFKEVLAYTNKIGGKFGLKFDFPTEFKTLQEYRNAILKVMQSLKGLPKGSEKTILDFKTMIGKADSDYLQKQIEKQLKELSDRISRTKTAKEFYEKILRLTRNEDLAFRATFSVFGQDKLDTFNDEVEQLKQNFGEIDITAAINLNTKQIDYKALREIWEADKALPDNLRKIPQAYDSAIKSILDAGDKLSERQFERWSRDLERAKQYYDKRIELAQYTETQIAEIEAKRDTLDPNSKGYERDRTMYDRMIKDYREREKNEGAKLDYEQIKEQIGMFDDIGIRLSESFKRILEQLREYTQSSEFARLGQEAQKNVYEQIDKLEDRIHEGFQGIGVGSVSTLVRDYSFAASQYLNAQEELKNATFAAIEADRNLTAVKNTGNEEAIKAAEAEKALADARVQSASATVNAASTDLMRTQHNAERASKQFEGNLERIGNSIRSLNNGALKPLWDMLGPKAHRKIGELLSGGSKLIKAAEKLQKAIDETEGGLRGFSESITEKILKATQDIDREDIEAITEATKNTLVEAFKGMGFGEDIAKYMADTMTNAIVSQLTSEATKEAISNGIGQSAEALKEALAKGGQSSGNMWGAIIGLILQLLDEFAENGIGEFIKTLLEDVGDAVNGILSELLETTIPGILEGVGELVQQVAYGIVNLLTFSAFDLGGRKAMKKANKLIEEQGKILKDLEYRYDRLGKIAEKVFGSDYIDNYNQQLKNLQAQQEAYLKQAEAEKSKGKKEDEEKTQEYLDKARDIGDQIADMQEDLIEHFTGSSRTDIARQMAQSWIDARASMSDTFAAIKGDYQDLIKNMLVETMAAKIIENAFSQVWKDVDERLKDNDVEGAVNAFFNGMDTALTNANDGMEVWWKAMEARGFDMKDMFKNMDSEYTGIAKSVAGATSEEINNVAAIGNTLLYYAAPIPRIDENLARVVALMEGKTAALPTASGGNTGTIDYTEMFTTANQHLSSLPRMEQHLAEIHTMLGRALRTKGSTTGFNTFLNS